MKIALLLIASMLLIPITAQATETTPSVEDLLKLAEKSIKEIKDYSGVLRKQEQFGSDVEKAIMEFKFARPFKVYIKFRTPHKGREAIFVRGWNDNEVRTHNGDFPDITLNLDPLGNTAMDENHHPISHFGLNSTIRISAKNLRKAMKRNEGEFKVIDGGTLQGQAVWKIEARFPKGGTFIKAKDDETLWDIGQRTGQDTWVIVTANKEFDEPDDVDEGDKVFIPRYYGGQSELWVNKETGLPVKATTMDWSGRLYESYEYSDMKFNQGMSARDFDPDNSKYNF